MYYTGINPLDGKTVYAPDDYREKLMQRALLQYKKPENRNLVREALTLAGREDLIGFSGDCLVKPDMRVGANQTPQKDKPKGAKTAPKNVKSTAKGGKNTKNKVENKTKFTKNKAQGKDSLTGVKNAKFRHSPKQNAKKGKR